MCVYCVCGGGGVRFCFQSKRSRPISTIININAQKKNKMKKEEEEEEKKKNKNNSNNNKKEQEEGNNNNKKQTMRSESFFKDYH